MVVLILILIVEVVERMYPVPVIICLSCWQLELTLRGRVGPAVSRTAAPRTREGFLVALVSWCAFFFRKKKNDWNCKTKQCGWRQYAVARGEK